MEILEVEEQIKVEATFENGRIVPLSFRWRQKEYAVQAVNFAWRSKDGAAELRHFAVTDGANFYELCFNSRTLEWSLSKLHSE